MWMQTRREVATSQEMPGHREPQTARKCHLSEGPETCLHLDCGLLATSTGQEHISIVSCPSVCGTLLQQPWETKGFLSPSLAYRPCPGIVTLCCLP